MSYISLSEVQYNISMGLPMTLNTTYDKLKSTNTLTLVLLKKDLRYTLLHE